MFSEIQDFNGQSFQTQKDHELDNTLYGKKKYPCYNCHNSYKLLKYLNYHLRYECGQGPRFFCPYCDYKGKYSSNTRMHIRRRHPGLQIYCIDVLKKAV